MFLWKDLSLPTISDILVKLILENHAFGGFPVYCLISIASYSRLKQNFMSIPDAHILIFSSRSEGVADM